MDDADVMRLAHDLEGRKDSIAESWYAAIAHTSFAPFSPAQVRQSLRELTAEAIALLVAPEPDVDSARAIGTSLARLHYTQPEALGRTQGVLARELAQGLSAEQLLALLPNLTVLLEGVATGFAEHNTAIQLSEQESIRRALVSELQMAERQLREARDHLEEQVEQRTEELRASQERYRDLLEKIDAVVATIDHEGVIRYASPQTTRLFGLHPLEVVGHPFHEFVFAEDLPHILEQFTRAEADSGDVCEFRFRTGSGELRWAHASVRPVFSGGELIAGHAVLTDVTERRRAAEALQASEERWHSLFTNAPDSIFILDPQGRIQLVNHLAPIADLTAQDLLGRYIFELPIAEHREAVRAAVEQVFASGTSSTHEVAVRPAAGVIAWYAGHIGPLWSDGRVVAAVLIARNITDQKRVDELKENLLRDVSHELRTPLAKAQLSLELLLERVDGNPIEPDSARKYSRMAFDNVRTLAQIVEGILDLSRLEARTQAVVKEPIRLGDLITAAVAHMEPLATGKGLTLEANVEEHLPYVEGHREMLSRVLHNLIDNAVKFSCSGPIVVSARIRGEGVEVSVTDRGCGILPGNLGRVFDRFFRESPEYPGVGIGLPMCKTIIEAHNGTIWAESPGPGQGATLRFVLPGSALSTTGRIAL